MSDQIQKFLSQVPATRGSGGQYMSQLTDESREVLDLFEQWLLKEDPQGLKKESTARAYKHYVAEAMVKLEEDPDAELSSDIKSAIGALRRFRDATVPASEANQVDE